MAASAKAATSQSRPSLVVRGVVRPDKEGKWLKAYITSSFATCQAERL